MRKVVNRLNLEEAQILANVSAALSNAKVADLISREEAKGILKQFLPKRENAKNIGNNTNGASARPVGKSTVSATADVK